MCKIVLRCYYIHVQSSPTVEQLLLYFVFDYRIGDCLRIPLGKELIAAVVYGKVDRILQMRYVVLVAGARVQDEDLALQVLGLVDDGLGVGEGEGVGGGTHEVQGLALCLVCLYGRQYVLYFECRSILKDLFELIMCVFSLEELFEFGLRPSDRLCLYPLLL